MTEISCTVDRIEEGFAVCISDCGGKVINLSPDMAEGLAEGDGISVTLDGENPVAARLTVRRAERKSENGERLRRLFDKHKK